MKLHIDGNGVYQELATQLRYNIPSMAKTFSVSTRLQRVTTETIHVSVLPSEDLWKPNPDAPGTLTIQVSATPIVNRPAGNA